MTARVPVPAAHRHPYRCGDRVLFWSVLPARFGGSGHGVQLAGRVGALVLHRDADGRETVHVVVPPDGGRGSHIHEVPVADIVGLDGPSPSAA